MRWVRTSPPAASGWKSKWPCYADYGPNHCSASTESSTGSTRRRSIRGRHSVPIWLGGFADVALHRAARIADGFICADGAADAFAQIARLQELLKEHDRKGDGFGFRCNMLKAKTPEQVVDTAQRWREAGGTDVAVNTMGQGFATADEHLDHIRRVADTLRQADLLR